MTHQDLALFVLASAAIALIPGPDILCLVGRGDRAGSTSRSRLHAGTQCRCAHPRPVGCCRRVSGHPAVRATVRHREVRRRCLSLLTGGQADPGPVPVDDRRVGPAPDAFGRVFGEGVVTDLLKPKVCLFFVSFLPQFVDPNGERVAADVLLPVALGPESRSATAVKITEWPSDCGPARRVSSRVTRPPVTGAR